MTPEHEHKFHQNRHASDLAKMTTGMLVGVLALMTFLLSVGLSHPKTIIEVFIYSSYVILGLGLIVYEVGNLFAARAKSLAVQEAPKDATKKAALVAKQTSAVKTVKAFRVAQQIIFLLSVIAVVGFAISTIQLFFPAASATSAATSAASSAGSQ